MGEEKGEGKSGGKEEETYGEYAVDARHEEVRV